MIINGHGRCKMKRSCLSVILAVLSMVYLSAYADQSTEDMLNAIVRIRSLVPADARTARSLGTEREGNGIVIDSRGHILTIGYLIVEAETIKVVGPEGKPMDATFIGYDHATGFGLLRVDKPLSVAPMKLGQSSDVKEGDEILVASHGGPDAAQSARVLSRREFAGSWEYLLEDAFFTIPPHPDFGGAAMIGRDGRLLGIGSLFTQVMIPRLGAIPCNMFVPIDLLKPILNDLITTGRSKEPPRPWLGLNAEEVRGRVFILRVTSGGPAEQAGLQSGDIILAVNSDAVNGLADFYRKVWALGSAGVEVPLSILQGIRISDVTVHSTDRYRYLQLKSKRQWVQATF